MMNDAAHILLGWIDTGVLGLYMLLVLHLHTGGSDRWRRRRLRGHAKGGNSRPIGQIPCLAQLQLEALLLKAQLLHLLPVKR